MQVTPVFARHGTKKNTDIMKLLIRAASQDATPDFEPLTTSQDQHQENRQPGTVIMTKRCRNQPHHKRFMTLGPEKKKMIW